LQWISSKKHYELAAQVIGWASVAFFVNKYRMMVEEHNGASVAVQAAGESFTPDLLLAYCQQKWRMAG